jgi:hypothetical protein
MRDYIIWELPLAEGLQLRHYALLKAGARCVATEESTIAEWDAIAEELKNVS